MRVGIAGEKGLHVWQGFKWAVENDRWRARVASIPKVFAAAAADLGKHEVDAEAVEAVWNRLVPGLLEVHHQIWHHSIKLQDTYLQTSFKQYHAELFNKCYIGFPGLGKDDQLLTHIWEGGS